MKAKFGALVVAGSGKINGFVASRNRAGAYFRTKVTPVNPQTSDQNTVRSRLATRAQAWRGLTADQRAAWNGAVANFAKTDVFGDLKNPSGFNLYVRLNNNLAAVGSSAITTPPVPAAVSTLELMSLSVAAGSPEFEITFSGAVPANTAVKVFATPGLSPGVNFVKSEYRLITVLPPAEPNPYDGLADYNAKFGALVAGQKIFLKVVFVSTVTGIESSAQSISAIVAA